MTLIEAREKYKNDRVTFVRIEQLYPFPVKTLANILKRYKKLNLFGVKKNQKIWVRGIL
jgi:2-oxoglutarate dehydrogenase complex dehydrogenase (E1) component-like enzyme